MGDVVGPEQFAVRGEAEGGHAGAAAAQNDFQAVFRIAVHVADLDGVHVVGSGSNLIALAVKNLVGNTPTDRAVMIENGIVGEQLVLTVAVQISRQRHMARCRLAWRQTDYSPKRS